MSSGTTTVIIPTLCAASRAALLRQAIDSILSQGDCVAQILVVVNGDRWEPATVEALKYDPRIVIEMLATASAPASQRRGRELVRTKYFAFLDDDDVYLPNALATRIAAIEETEADLVSTDGLRFGKPNCQVSGTVVNSDPLSALTRGNWLASCGGLYRTASIGLEFFDGTFPQYEWTMIAFRVVSAGRKIHFLDDVTYSLGDTPGSASKETSASALNAQLAVMEYMFRNAPPRVRDAFRRRYIQELYDASWSQLRHGERSEGWRNYWRCLAAGGFRYILFLRFFVFPWLRPA
jgi:glycosyltransferase involved in cell wall biosynthesis